MFKNISKDFLNDNMKQTELNEYLYGFSVSFGSIDVGDILDNHKHLRKKHDLK